MSVTPTHSGEVQFVTFADSSKGGPRITLRLQDRDELEAFVGMEGKRFMCVLVAIGDDEQPVPPPAKAPAQKLGPLALSAVQFCKNPAFWQWINHESEEDAAQWLKLELGVASRRDIDGDKDAPARFRVLAREFSEYTAAMQRQKVPA